MYLSFQITLYPEGTTQIIKSNSTSIPITAPTRKGDDKIKLGRIINFGFIYAFYPAIFGEEDNFLRINVDCNRGMYWVQRYENIEV